MMHSLAHRARLPLALAVCVTLLATALLVTTTSTADAASRWSGYSVPKTKQAASGWIGGLKMGPRKVYRLDPTKRQIKGKYAKARLVSDFYGAKGPSRRSTQRAAWILSNYGARNNDVQAAAVDAAVFHLLKGKRWRIYKAKGSKRIRQTPYPSYVRSYARQMIRESKSKAGAYSTRVATRPAAVGSGMQVRFSITTGGGKHRGLSGLPVKFTYGAAQPLVAYTNKYGVAVVNFPAVAGVNPVTATVSRVPEWRLVMRQARWKRATPVAIAGVSRKIRVTGTATGVSSQVLSVANKASSITTSTALGGIYTITGASGAQEVVRRVHGPFGQASGGCTGTPLFSSTATSTDSGSTPLPGYTPTKSGYYRWGVSASGNSATDPASTCGALVRVVKPARVTQQRPTGAPARVVLGKPFRLTFNVSGFDRWESHTVISRLYGPFANRENAKCSARRFLGGKNQTRNVTGNGTFTTGKVSLSNATGPGWYVWQTTLSTGDLIRGDVTSCGVPYQMVK